MMLDLINFTQKQVICVGKPGEQPIGAIMRYLATSEYKWDLTNDLIEVVNYELQDMSIKGFQDLTDKIDWSTRDSLWEQYNDCARKTVNEYEEVEES
jgi:hypothetical protein